MLFPFLSITNAIAFLVEDMTVQEVHDLHREMISEYITYSKICWKEIDGGHIFDYQHADAEVHIAPTVSLRDFYRIKVKLSNCCFEFEAMPGIVPHEVIAILMGISPDVVLSSLKLTPMSHPHRSFAMWRTVT